MEFKKGSIVVTKYGEYVLKDVKTFYNPFNLKPINVFIVDDNGLERSVTENKVITVRNNHLENVEEP